MACVAFETFPDGANPGRYTKRSITLEDHDPNDLEFAVDVLDNGGARVLFRQCKRCNVLYRGMEPSFILKAQDATGARAVDKDPEKMGGSPCVAGTRVPVAGVLEHLAAGYSVTRIATLVYTALSEEQIIRAIRWTAEAIEGFPDQPPPKPSNAELDEFIDARLRESTGFDHDPVIKWLRHQAEAE